MPVLARTVQRSRIGLIPCFSPQTPTITLALPVQLPPAWRGDTSPREVADQQPAMRQRARPIIEPPSGGERCVECRRKLVMTHEIDNRQTVFCKKCQR
jgi:hypothetical protein